MVKWLWITSSVAVAVVAISLGFLINGADKAGTTNQTDKDNMEVIFSAAWDTGSDYGLSNSVEIPGGNLIGYDGSGRPTIARAESGAEGVKAHSGDGYLQMQGQDISQSDYGYIYNKVYEKLDIVVTDGMKLKYWVYHHQYNASRKMSVDLIFSDQTTLRDSGLTDAQGILMHPGSREDPLDKWVLVECDLSPLAGKTINRIVFSYSADATISGPYSSYFDDLTIEVPEGAAASGIVSSASIREASRLRLEVLNSTSRESACTLVTPGQDESLGEALAEVLKANGNAPGAFCINPGNLDKPIHVNGPITLILYPGIYTQTEPITISGKQASLMGIGGAGSTTLLFKDGVHGANIVLDSFTSSYKISGLTLARESDGISEEDNGIRTGQSSDYGLIENVMINKQYNGMHLQVTSYTRIEKLIISESANTGIYMTNGLESEGGGPCQYYLNDILFTMNKGFAIEVSPDAGSMPIGNWSGILTFGNQKGGIILKAHSSIKAVHGLRLANSFLGQDGEKGGYPEITIEGGGMHNISDTFVEIGGVGANAPYLSHPDVPGILIDAGVTTAQLNAVYVANNTGSGLVIKGNHVLITASTFSTNGMNATSDEHKTGILILNERSNVNVGLSQFIASGTRVDPKLTAHSTGIKSNSGHVTLTGVTFDENGGAKGYVGP
ncbi:hypothetical protein [Paenibacillus eucommiae]|uniref:Right-handed parallel beta-helix repeat-containing protein n=1 Tax=Paenibacillus eucommiae TaxID=1355755 RepID=A0ABS4J2R7_9BACL|nr:hypothetical protein [Paenibacillus eucommiae]MBP1993104.1 hypothetical protein [Paenibacillus eucommiae]